MNNINLHQLAPILYPFQLCGVLSETKAVVYWLLGDKPTTTQWPYSRIMYIPLPFKKRVSGNDKLCR